MRLCQLLSVLEILHILIGIDRSRLFPRFLQVSPFLRTLLSGPVQFSHGYTPGDKARLSYSEWSTCTLPQWFWFASAFLTAGTEPSELCWDKAARSACFLLTVLCPAHSNRDMEDVEWLPVEMGKLPFLERHRWLRILFPWSIGYSQKTMLQSRVCQQSWGMKEKNNEQEKIGDWRSNLGRGKKWKMSYCCWNSLSVHKPRHRQIVATYWGSDTVKLFTGHLFSCRQKTRWKATCYSRKHNDFHTFCLTVLLFCVGS